MTFVQPAFWSVPRGRAAQRWSPVLVTAATAVIALAEAKLHARMNATVTTEDAAVASWTAAATQQVENDTGVKLGLQTHDLAGDRFPAGVDPIALPFGPLLSVTHIKFYDSAMPSVLQTMLASEYIADVTRVPGRIGLANSATWPTDLRDFQPVTLRVVVGFDAIAKIPAPLLQAVREAIAWHAMHREPTAIEQQSYDRLIGPYQMPVVA